MSTSTALKDTNTNSLLGRFTALKQQKPTIRPKDAAAELGVSEAELVAARIDGKTIFRLENKPEDILLEVKKFGTVMALTRNELCVHEREGVYDNVSFMTEGPMRMGLAVNPDIDLRLFMGHWAHVFAVTEETKAGPKKSLQFYGKDGTAIHKIYLLPESNEGEYDKLVAQFKAADQAAELKVEPAAPKMKDAPDEQVNAAAFEAELANLKDTHDFYMLLRKHRIGRVQAYRLTTDQYSYKVDNNAARKILEAARDKNCEIMVFVGNKGCIQIHTGPVQKLVEYEGWYNVLDPKFNLHLKDVEIATSWVVKKPTEDGIVTSLELFDKDNELIVTFFGKRKPGIPELELWRNIIATLPKAN